METIFEVIVGNIGTVYSGTSLKQALVDFSEYKTQSKNEYGRAAGEDVFLMHNNETKFEFYGSISINQIEDF